MKTKLLFVLIFISTIPLFSQTSTTPNFPTKDVEITIHFDATGTGLENYNGDVYAHTGLITSESISNADWKYVIGGWGENNTQPKLTKTGTNTYDLTISPSIVNYYATNANEDINHIAIVFRSADGTKQTSPDILIPIFEDELNVVLNTPKNNQAINLNSTINISGVANKPAIIELFVNDQEISKSYFTKTISKDHTFSSGGAASIKIKAAEGGVEKASEISVYVKTPTQTATKPTNLKYGVNKTSNSSVTLLLQASQKNDVFVIGDFNNWKLNQNYQMKKDGDDFWLTIDNLDSNTEYAYQFVIDYDLKIADPYAEKVLDPNNDQYIPESTYPNLKSYPLDLTTGIVSTFLINDTYQWNITNFERPNKNNLVIYELLIRDFTTVGSDDIGDFKTAITKLDYLKELGINAIELLPISEFEGNDSWGYNPSFHNALDKAYGTKNDFKTFVDACHSRGIAVIIDVVYNHAYSQSPLAQMYWDSDNFKPLANNPYLNPDAKHPFNVGYDFNHENPYTKTYVKQTLVHWIEEYKIDGFRFDLSKGFTQTNNPNDVGEWNKYDASRVAILTDYANHIWNNTASDIYLVLEHLSDNSEEVALANHGFMLWGNMNHNYNQNTMGWTADTEISWISHKSRGYNDPHVVGYMESHDEERLMYKNLQFGNSTANYNVKDLSTALERQELAGCFFIPIPGPKMIWQFGELGYQTNIDFNGRTGRKPIYWEYYEEENRKDIYDTWAILNKLKTTRPEFNTSNFDLDTGGLVKRIYLNGGAEHVVIIGNFDVVSQSKNPAFPVNTKWYEVFSNTELEVNNSNKNTAINLQPGEYKMYSTYNYDDLLSIDKTAPVASIPNLYPNPSKVGFKTNIKTLKVEIFDNTGKSLKTFEGNFKSNYIFDIQELNAGIFYVKITTSKGNYIEKLIKI